MIEQNIKEINEALTEAVDLDTELVCVYGSDHIPEKSLLVSSASSCLASAIYEMAKGNVSSPLYAAYEPQGRICRCMGGPAWFGYSPFDSKLMSLLASGSDELIGCSPKHLKENRNIAKNTICSIGKVKPLGRYVIMSCCNDIRDDREVRCIICFADGEQTRDLCALAHFGTDDVFGSISIPWGPSCATMITYPAGMAENAPNALFIGPTDPSAREWLPKGCMILGIPIGIAKRMAKNANESFLAKLA